MWHNWPPYWGHLAVSDLDLTSVRFCFYLSILFYLQIQETKRQKFLEKYYCNWFLLTFHFCVYFSKDFFSKFVYILNKQPQRRSALRELTSPRPKMAFVLTRLQLQRYFVKTDVNFLGKKNLHWIWKIGKDVGSLIENTSNGNFRIFLPLRFYVKSILAISELSHFFFRHNFHTLYLTVWTI